jgi:hypothetical protein
MFPESSMDIQDPRWPEYEKKFQELAFLADEVDSPDPPLDQCRYYLCLYGENGLTPDEEFEFLNKMEDAVGKTLKKVVIDTSYWQDTVLFVP